MKYYVVLKSDEEIGKFASMNSISSIGEGRMCTALHFSLNGTICVDINNEHPVLSCSPSGSTPRLIVTFEQYLALQAKKPAQERITAEEVIKVLTETRKYEEIFGGDHSLYNLFRIFTPREIVSKIADWRDKQVEKVKVNEDMIADALDEKFGVGKWTREEN